MGRQPQSLDRRAEQRALFLIYSSSAGYMVALGMMQVLVPLYALRLGYDIGEIGIIVASQAVFGLALRLFGGAISDQFGERWVLWFSFITICLGSLVFALSGAFWALIAGQLFMGISRANYWTSTQSYASRIDATRAGEALGRIGGFGNAGQVIGTFGGAALAATLGYTAAFGVGAAIGAAGLAGSLILPSLPRKAVQRGFKQALAPVPGFIKSKGMAMASIAAFMASASMAFGQVLFIPYFEQAGYGETMNGALRTLSIGGSVATGIVFGAILARTGQKRLYTLAFAFMGLTLCALPWGANAIWVLVPLMVWHGMWHGLLGAVYTTTAATQSAAEQRGMAMGYVGLYWGIAQLAVPAAFGFLARAAGLPVALWAAGALFLAAAVTTPSLFSWLVERPSQAPARQPDLQLRA